MRHPVRPVAALAVLGATLAALASCGGQPEAHAAGGGMPPPPVGVAAPIPRELPVVREITGRLEAVQTVELRPRVSGVVERVLVADGAEVKEGDVVLEIDQRVFVANLAKASADVARAESRLDQARILFGRAKNLVEQKIVSQQSYDDAAAAVKTGEAEVAAAKATRDSAQLDLGYTKVTAPVGGRIGKVVTTTGNLVQGGGPVPATLIATIVTIDPVYAVFDLDETTWNAIGGRLRAAAGGGAAVPVAVGLAGESGYPHHGNVAFVDNQIDSASGSIRVRARLPNADRALVSGAYARIQLEIAAPRPVLLINERAVQSQLTTRYVLVVDDQGGTSFRPVKLGDSVDQLRVVDGGLAPTDTIAVNNLSKIFFPGMPVTRVPASMLTGENDAPPAGAPGAPGAPGAAPAKADPAASAKTTDAKPADPKSADAKPADAKPIAGGKQP